MARIGDLDGNGVTELAVGAPRNNDGGYRHGAVWILFLNSSGTVMTHQRVSSRQGGFTGILDANDAFAVSVEGLADPDGAEDADDTCAGTLLGAIVSAAAQSTCGKKNK